MAETCYRHLARGTPRSQLSEASGNTLLATYLRMPKAISALSTGVTGTWGALLTADCFPEYLMACRSYMSIGWQRSQISCTEAAGNTGSKSNSKAVQRYWDRV